MQIFEAGYSAALQLRSQPVVYKTFVCVLDNAQDKSLDEAIQEVITFLGDKLDNFNKDLLIFTTKTGDKYTIANELTIKDKQIIRRPANILRHTFSQLYTINSLYINEDNEIIDLSQKACNDISNWRLKILFDKYEEYLELNPDELIVLIVAYISREYEFSDSLFDTLTEYEGTKKINNLTALAEVLNTGSLFSNMERLSRFTGLMKYLTQVCGLEVKLQFVDNPTLIIVDTPPKRKRNIIPDVEMEPAINLIDDDDD